MLNSIWDDLKYSMRTGDMATKLIVINFAVFVLTKLLFLILGGFTMGNPDSAYSTVLHYFCVPGDPMRLLMQPWSLITHIFLHDNLWHLISNLLFLHLFARIVSDLIGDRRILPLYILGGLTGALFFIVSAVLGIIPAGYALGASGAVMVLGGATLILAPDYRVSLLLLGNVKVKYIVLVQLLLDLTAVAGSYNSGGPIAHIAGFLLGCVFVYQLRDGKDWTEPVDRVLTWIEGLFSGRSKYQKKNRKPGPMKATYVRETPNSAQPTKEHGFQERLDTILDKIKQSGYESLTTEEKEFLYQASQK